LKERIETWILLFLVKGGEGRRERAFDRIWRKYYRRIRFFVQNRVPGDAEDLTQEIMLKVYRNLERFDPNRSFNAWIYSIARNHCINHAAKKRPETGGFPEGSSAGILPSGSNTPESAYLDLERRQVIDSTLAALDQDLRETAFLRFHEGMRGREIALITGVPEGTVKSRIHTIRAKLKEALEVYNEN